MRPAHVYSWPICDSGFPLEGFFQFSFKLGMQKDGNVFENVFKLFLKKREWKHFNGVKCPEP